MNRKAMSVQWRDKLQQWIFEQIRLIFALSIAAVGFLYWFQPFPEHRIWSISAVQINIVVSLLLSAALVYFYYNMWTVQDRQAEIASQQTQILERQVDISAAAHTPNIRFGKESYPDTGTFALEVRNTGNGIAKNLQFTSLLLVDNPLYNVVPESTPVQAEHVDVPGRPVDFTADESTEIQAQLQFRLNGTGRFSDSITSFPGAIRKLHHTGSSICELRFGLTYEDIIGDKSGKTVASGRFLLPSGYAIESALKVASDSISEPWLNTGESTAQFTDLHGSIVDQPNPPKAAVRFDIRDPPLESPRGTITITPQRLSSVQLLQADDTVYETDIESNQDEPIQMEIGSNRDIELVSDEELIEVVGEYDGKTRTIELIAIPDRHPDVDTNAKALQRIFATKR